MKHTGLGFRVFRPEFICIRLIGTYWVYRDILEIQGHIGHIGPLGLGLGV